MRRLSRTSRRDHRDQIDGHHHVCGDRRQKDRKDSTVGSSDRTKALASGYACVHRRPGLGSGSLFSDLGFELGCNA